MYWFQQWQNQPPLESQEPQLNFGPHTIIAGVLCFMAASISSAGGIGGGGLFIPILNIVAGLDLKTASSFSAFMVTGGSVANVICSLCVKNPKFGGKSLIDYDITLLSQPCMLVGVSIGVICNVSFPEWLVVMLFSVFLAWCTFKTCGAGVFHWKLESEKLGRNVFGDSGNCLLRKENSDGREGEQSVDDAILGERATELGLGIPWKKLGLLVIIWFCFFLLCILRGDKHGQSLIQIEPCGVAYWMISSLQIPFAIIFTACFLCQRVKSQDQTSNEEEMEMEMGSKTTSRYSSKVIFPIMALLAGVLGGVFGIGGGMLISPLLLEVGIPPEVTAATCSFMVFFSSSMSAAQYILLGMKGINDAILFTCVCFVASLLGLMVVQRAVVRYGRASVIVFSVGTVMALSAVVTTSFGIINVWNDYKNGKYMGFRLPC